jgi:hypothetical protein
MTRPAHIEPDEPSRLLDHAQYYCKTVIKFTFQIFFSEIKLSSQPTQQDHQSSGAAWAGTK